MTCLGDGCRGKADARRTYSSLTLSTPFGAVRMGTVALILLRESAQDARNVKLDESLCEHSVRSISDSFDRCSGGGTSRDWRRSVCWKRSWLISSTREIASLRVGVDEFELARAKVSGRNHRGSRRAGGRGEGGRTHT